MQKIKRPLSIILTILMLVTMIPFSSLTASAGNGQEVGDFVLRGGVEGTDFKYENGVLTVLTDKHLIIQNQNSLIPTKDRIYVAKDVSANIEMSGVKIDVSNKYVPAFEIAEGSTGNVTINLGLDAGIGVDFVERSKNYLKSGASHAGIQKNSNEDSGKLTIVGQGMLTAIGGERAAGIGVVTVRVPVTSK